MLLVIPIQAQFDTMDQIASYAATLQEFPDADGDYWEHPDFSSTYATFQESAVVSFLKWIGITIPFTITRSVSIYDLKRLVDQINHDHVQHTSEVHKIVPAVNSRCVVFGDIRGAFHSFVRDLEQLVQLHILTRDLHLTENSYLIFNGNVINGSPYNMQTLYVLLILMKKNPERVVYIKGDLEQTWYSESQLFKQLRILGADDALYKSVTTFFQELPTHVYVAAEDNQGIVIQAGVEQPQTGSDVRLVSSITANSSIKTVGLRRSLGPPTSWSVFSSPTGTNRRLYGFLYDAFAIVQTAVYIENWTISLYYRNAQRQASFNAPSVYNMVIGNLISGASLDFFDQKERTLLKKEVVKLEQEVQQLQAECLARQQLHTEQQSPAVASAAPEQPLLAMHDDVLVFGCTLDLSKGVRNQSLSLQAGLLAKIDELNAAGGIQGKTVQVIFLDDEYTPLKAKENVLTFLNEFKTDTLLCPIGTPTLEAYIDLVKEHKILVLFPITGALIFKVSGLENVIQFRPSYADELEALTEYVVAHKNAKRFLIFYQQDAFGQAHIDAVKKVLQRLDITQIQEVSYERNELSFVEKITKIKEFDPDTFICISTATPAQHLIRQMGANFFIGKNIYGISNNFGEASFRNFMKLKGLNFYVANVVPNPATSDIEIAQEFRQQAKKMNVVLDSVSFEGYIMATLTAYILQQVEGVITQEKIIDVVQHINNLDFKGLTLDFSPRYNRLSHRLWISEGFDENWIQIDLRTIDQ